MATGGELISPNGVVAVMTVAFVLYSFFGGLVAAAYTDFVQGFLIIVLSFMLIPAGWRPWAVRHAKLSGRWWPSMPARCEAEHAGMTEDGRTACHSRQRQGTAGFFDLYNEASGMDAFTILMLTLNGLIGITAQPHMLAMYATGRSERAGRVGQTYGSMVKRFCTIGWALTGLIVAAMVVQQRACLPDKEDAFGYACLHLLGPGWVGLMVACVRGGQHVGLLEPHGQRRRPVHPQHLSRTTQPGRQRPGIALGGRISGLGSTWPASASP